MVIRRSPLSPPFPTAGLFSRVFPVWRPKPSSRLTGATGGSVAIGVSGRLPPRRNLPVRASDSNLQPPDSDIPPEIV